MPNMTTYCHSEADTGRNRTEVSSVTRIASSPIAVTTQPIHFLSKKNSRPMPISSGTSIRPVASEVFMPKPPHRLPHEKDTTKEFSLYMAPLTADERKILADGCLINFYKH